MSTRRDPKGKRALFETPPTRPENPLEDDVLVETPKREGRDALYSTGPHVSGTVVVDCSYCGVRTRTSLVDALIRVLLVSLWIPGKRFSRWLQCPSCQRRSWTRIEWSG